MVYIIRTEEFMETKLTLKLDKEVIQLVKIYADSHNRSLSKLVEDYFRNLISENENEKHYSPLVEELSGVISENDLEGIDYISYLEKKYE
jgi:hypothetical protein